MKILMLADKMDIGGAETHIITLIEALLERGVNITLVSGGGVYIKTVLSLGVGYREAPLDKRDPLSMLKSRRIVKEEMQRCNIVHAHTRFCANLAKSIRGKGCWPPILVTAHLDFPKFPYGKRCFFGDATLAVSDDIKRHLMKVYGTDGKKIRLTKNGINIADWQRQAQKKKLIIHTSRIDKGRSRVAFLLADSASQLLSDNPEYKILIIGDGNDMPTLREKAQRANEALGKESIILAGKRTDVPSILCYGEIYVGVSRGALEAMAAGVPTVIAGDEGFGGIIDESNFSALAYSNFCARGLPRVEKDNLMASISELIQSQEKRDRLTIIYKSRIAAEYSAQSMANDAYNCYSLLKRAPRVLLMGYFGFSNLGDEVTLFAATEALYKIGIREISVLTGNKDFVPRKATKVYIRSSFTEINEAIDNSDIFVMCGGNLLQNETGELSLLYYNEIMNLARLKRKAVYMISSGFGEVRGKFGKMLLSRGIKKSSFCGCRTEYDLKIAKLFGQKKAILMPDLCFLLGENKKAEEARSFAYIPSGEASLSGEKLLKIGKQRDLTPIAIILFPDQDRHCLNEFTRLGITCYFPKSYERVSELLAKCAFTVTERLHGAIFSILNYTPCYVTTDSAKNRALLHEVTRHGKDILIPFTEDSVLMKKEQKVKSQDFGGIIGLFRERVIKGIAQAF